MRTFPVALAWWRAPFPKGQKAIVTIATSNTGTHKVAWYVAGTKVGGGNFEVIAG